MTLQQEANEIIANAAAALKSGEITPEQYMDATHAPLKDLLLCYDTGGVYLIEKERIYKPPEMKA